MLAVEMPAAPERTAGMLGEGVLPGEVPSLKTLRMMMPELTARTTSRPMLKARPRVGMPEAGMLTAIPLLGEMLEVEMLEPCEPGVVTLSVDLQYISDARCGECGASVYVV
jgi:hypothetical protein